MKFLLTLAWKNLSRYRRRTIITATAIAVGIALYILVDAWLLGIENESERNLVYYETGSARIMQKKYWDEKDFRLVKYYLKDPAAIEDRLRGLGYATTRRISFLGQISRLVENQGSFQIKLAAIDVNTDSNVFKLKQDIRPEDGRYLQAGSPEIMLGRELAADLDVHLGESVLVLTRTATGAWDDIELMVVGLLNTPNPLINKGSGFVPLDYAQERLQMPGGATEVVVGFPVWEKPEAEMVKIKAALRDLPGYADWVALDYKDLAKEFVMIAATKSGGSKIILLLIFIIAVIGISNTMLMAVFERVKEIGMMRAMGMKDSSIVWSFFFEASGIGFIGALAGLVLGILLTAYMVTWGVDMSGFVKGMGNIGYRTTGVFKAWWNPDTMISAFFIGIIISGLVSFFPALRAVKMRITDCLRNR